MLARPMTLADMMEVMHPRTTNTPPTSDPPSEPSVNMQINMIATRHTAFNKNVRTTRYV